MRYNYGIDVRPTKEIARGGFGRVCIGAALNEGLRGTSGGTIVVKELLDVTSEHKQDSFYQEISIMAFLKEHKNIAQIIGYTETPYTIIMKYYPMGSLTGWIESRTVRRSKNVVISFSKDIALGLSFVHSRGYIHADLKSQNILLDEQKGKVVCVLTDFGISQNWNVSSLKVHAMNVVSINGASMKYAAPEAIMRIRQKTYINAEKLPALDVYSFGVVMFEIIGRLMAWKHKLRK